MTLMAWRTLSTALELERQSLSHALTPIVLQEENQLFRHTGGVSHCNRGLGFVPAFRDDATGCIYPSCCADGRPAIFHNIQGLPSEIVLERDVRGHAVAIKPSVVAGFLREGHFFTREQTARLLAENKSH